jgi:polyphosphate kinase
VVVRREGEALRTYCHFGTGNYHPQTARVYTDLACSPATPLGRDAGKLFNFITGYAQPRRAGEAVVLARDMKPDLLTMIGRGRNAREGKPAASGPR